MRSCPKSLDVLIDVGTLTLRVSDHLGRAAFEAYLAVRALTEAIQRSNAAASEAAQAKTDFAAVVKDGYGAQNISRKAENMLRGHIKYSGEYAHVNIPGWTKSLQHRAVETRRTASAAAALLVSPLHLTNNSSESG